MKKGFLYLLFAATFLFATSCDKNINQEWDLPNSYAYATLQEVVSGTSGDSVNSDKVYFEMDNGKTFNIRHNKSTIDYNRLEAGKRFVLGITLSDATNSTYDYTADLYEVVNVKEGESKVVETEEQSDEIADNFLSYIVSDASLTLGYLNLYVGFMSENVNKVNFYLVENLIDGETDEDKQYLNLELRFDNASTESFTPEYESYVSFDMEQYREKLSGKEGIVLRVKTLKSGLFHMNVDIKDLFPEKD